jgi:hypothetical protein
MVLDYRTIDKALFYYGSSCTDSEVQRHLKETAVCLSLNGIIREMGFLQPKAPFSKSPTKTKTNSNA